MAMLNNSVVHDQEKRSQKPIKDRPPSNGTFEGKSQTVIGLSLVFFFGYSCFSVIPPLFAVKVSPGKIKTPEVYYLYINHFIQGNRT
jgi:hypothetical protein